MNQNPNLIEPEGGIIYESSQEIEVDKIEVALEDDQQSEVIIPLGRELGETESNISIIPSERR